MSKPHFVPAVALLADEDDPNVTHEEYIFINLQSVLYMKVIEGTTEIHFEREMTRVRELPAVLLSNIVPSEASAFRRLLSNAKAALRDPKNTDMLRYSISECEKMIEGNRGKSLCERTG